jgi:hypothetical protein
VIYDLQNRFIAFHKELLLQKIIVGKDEVFIITLPEQQLEGQRKLSRLLEKENAFKMEQFFRKANYDVAYQFAKSQNADPALLAEISRLHGDYRYEKGDL